MAGTTAAAVPDSPAVVAEAHPSLALVKYWGKQPGGVNLPATSSLGVTLEALTTRTECRITNQDSLTVDGKSVDPGKLTPFFDEIRAYAGVSPTASWGFAARSWNSFPTAAGLASSASGFAALALATVAAAGGDTGDRAALSALARHGSGSAARSIFGGFTAWRAGAVAAEEIYPKEWWPEVRIVVLPLSAASKPISSRDAMNHTRDTSPYYAAWVADAPTLFDRAYDAVARRDMEALGAVMRASYLRMFSTMLSADPPVEYWIPASVAVQRQISELRAAGVAAWETMDAGPQVKVLTTAAEAERVAQACADWCSGQPIISAVGDAAGFVTSKDSRTPRQ
ncbi:MAG: diphosphomevalonate decarboxylase [Alkalispirochaeta sp.]